MQKCPYCDFNSHAIHSDEIPEDRYIQALIADLDCQLDQVRQTSLASIFIGGGTPSLISPNGIDALLTAVSSRFNINDIEITMEANPGTFDQSNFSGYFAAGVNRLSIGAQSFSAEKLKALGRIHMPDETIKAFEGARAAGFKRINLDLMHGLPNQSVASAMADLEQAVALGPEHISWYELTIEPNTVFYSRPPTVPDDDVLEEITRHGLGFLHDEGYTQYEVSAFARKGEASLHNMNYWQFGDYLGIGAGAHGKLTDVSKFAITRTQKTRVPKDYLERSTHTQFHTVPAEDVSLEFLMNALRLTDGFEMSLFVERTGQSEATLESQLSAAISKGWIHPIDGDSIQLTALGKNFLNTVLAELNF